MLLVTRAHVLFFVLEPRTGPGPKLALHIVPVPGGLMCLPFMLHVTATVNHPDTVHVRKMQVAEPTVLSAMFSH